MFDDECFDELYAKLNDVVNSAYNLGEIYDQPKIVRKILSVRDRAPGPFL